MLKGSTVSLSEEIIQNVLYESKYLEQSGAGGNGISML